MGSRNAMILDRASNEVVRIVRASTGAEAARLIGSMPKAAQKGVTADLKQCGEAYRFDLTQGSAYYFERQGVGLVLWHWQHLGSYDEIGELLSLVATLDEPLTEKAANRLFEIATQRTITSPQPVKQDFPSDFCEA